ncbi:hypothetical protein BDY21DRAFT_366433 [Lineolata rhizophorae]|uniref:Uncharacterized protein n=1 Tax=Lineolata rhizophorae TaxID=578093 RepID=A0A6A6NRK1_9PEZI|nr:hypothetical protein BDY21DRAFT_366433 [Lineolata rhizophorae]
MDTSYRAYQPLATDRDDGESLIDATAPLSIGGIEPVMGSPRYQGGDNGNGDVESAGTDDLQIVVTTTNRGLDVVQAKKDVYDSIYDGMTNKLMSLSEDADMMIRGLAKEADKGFQRTYIRGQQARQVYEGAPVLKVGLSYLPGADKPEVNRLEQTNMIAKGLPDQRDAKWRVDTAASLLYDFRVTRDLSVELIDHTAQMAEKALLRSRNRRSLYSYNAPPETQGVVVRDRMYDAVTIDSEEVKIVNDLGNHRGEFDVESTLIEVDAPSLMNLIVQYRTLIRRGGPVNNFEETKSILETMIEDVRRLCHRSPILFRMSTRTKIITSKNTRYGFNQGRKFQTLTTSRGIQELISFSASYYNALDPERGGGAVMAQKYIRPRFLQMVVLLLSLLNDNDLIEIRDFIEATYKFKADRKNLELLFFKVIPLMSINSKVFLSSMVPAFEGWAPKEPESDEQAHYWDTFLRQILPLGYILPGTVSSLGRDPLSWVYKWPEEGFKSSAVFANLQYSGHSLNAFNDIPPLEELSPAEDDTTELTVVMTNDERYTIRASDYEAIICLTPGTHSVQEAHTGGRHYDLVIREEHLNRQTKDAFRTVNGVIKQVNYQLTGGPRRSGTVRSRFSIRRKPTSDLVMLAEVKLSGRLTKHTALLNNYPLAVAYKLEGRKIEHRDAIGIMAQDNREINEVVRYYESRLQDQSNTNIAQQVGLDFESLRRLEEQFSYAHALIQQAEDVRHGVEEDPISLSEPIAKVIQPSGGDSLNAAVWYPYRAWSTSMHGGSLAMEAQRSTITNVVWRREDIVEVSLEGSSGKYFVNPLEPVDNARREDEVREGDIVVLAGKYLIVAEPSEDELSDSLIMTNYLRITGIEELVQSARGRNRAGGRGANRTGTQAVQITFV